MANPAQGIAAVAAAYSRAAKGEVPGLDSQAPRPREEFANLVKGAIDGAIETGQEGERKSLSAITGQGDLNKVVTAVAEAEITLQTVVAVRDKVLEAYKEIIRMPI
ncbi:MAG: flagellar hook-basal body complex protein FliE [Rhodospirillales bacterium]|jgi:flagellar hook-basal body complex protein FliE|nr:flagellar hook-basal body complex protein FliE [Rhodospirillales bacterium]